MRLIGTFVLLLCFCGTGLAQVHQRIIRENPDLPFDQLVAKIEAQYQGIDRGRGSGYKQFKRWEYFHSSRLDEDGRIQNVPRRLLNEFMDYRSAKSVPTNLNFDCQWGRVGGHTYQRVVSGHNGGLGRVNAIVFDPDDSDIIYVGTPAGGLWRTTNGGGAWDPSSAATHWEPLTDGIPITSVSGIAVDPTSPAGSRTIYILTGDGDGSDNPSIGVLKSFDGGDTWYQTGLRFDLNSNFVFGYKLLMDPDDPNTLFAATSAGIWRTTDGGVNWTRVLTDAPIFDMEFRPGTPETIYAVTQSTFYRSTDGGDTWPTSNCGLANTGVRLAIGVTPADPDYVYVLSGGLQLDGLGNNVAGTFRGLYRSINGGDCFNQMSTTPNILDDSMTGDSVRQQATYDLAIAVSPTDEDEVHVGGINSWRSMDGGVTWALTAFWNENSAGAGNYNHADVHALEYIGNTLYSGSDGGIYETTNNADDWTNISQGLVITQFYRIAAFTDGGTEYIMGGAQDNGLNQMRDSGSGFGGLEHWEGADGFGCSVDQAADLVFGAIQSGTIYSFNYPSGAFNDVSPGLATGGAFLTPHTFDPISGALVAGYTDVWSTKDSGATWTNISNGMIGAMSSCRHIEVAPSDSNTIYVAKPFNLYRTTDGGTSWSNITAGLPTALNSIITYIAIHPTDPDRVWVTMGGFVRSTVNGYDQGNKVYYSDDGGATWTNISGSLPNIPANCIIYENGSDDGLYVGMDVGVYYRDNTMDDWLLFSNGLPNAIVADMDINYATGKLYVGTYGRGVWCTNLFSTCNQVCLNCPTFEEIHSQSNIYSSEDCVYSSSVVYDETSVTYSAEEFILLRDSFHVQSANDARFYAVIQTCAPGMGALARIANTREVSGYYVGPLPQEGKAVGQTISIGDSPEPTLDAPRIYPNPTAETVQLEFRVERPGSASIVVYDSRGRQVAVLEQAQHWEAGLYRQSYHLRELVDGTYFVVLTFEGQVRYQPLIKQSR